jgi:uncharacterized protein
MPATQRELPLDDIAEFCRRWRISQLELFGSALRDDFRPESDMDFMFTPGPGFEREKAFGPWGRDNMAKELTGMLGHQVDLVERSQVEHMDNWIKREHILVTASSVYVD